MAPPTPTAPQRSLRTGYLLGLLGVATFALTMPMTRLALGSAAAPGLDAIFVALGRAAVAGALSALLLLATRAPWPARSDWPWLGATAAGVVFGFPLFSTQALRSVESVHASVVIGLLPLATAACGALLARQRPSIGFWACSAAGSALVVGYALLRAGSWRLHGADLLLVAAVVAGALGYATGARLAAGRLRAEHVICWALVLALPVTAPVAWLLRPQGAVAASAWLGFGYTALFSMWLGFFAWYRGLALGGTVRVSQVQLLQPFLALVAAALLLGERVDALALGFALAVLATVFAGRRMAVHPSARARIAA